MAIGLLPKETLYITVHLEDSLLYLGFADPDPPPKKNSSLDRSPISSGLGKYAHKRWHHVIITAGNGPAMELILQHSPLLAMIIIQIVTF